MARIHGSCHPDSVLCVIPAEAGILWIMDPRLKRARMTQRWLDTKDTSLIARSIHARAGSPWNTSQRLHSSVTF